MTKIAGIMPWLPFAIVPFAAWSKDLTVVAVALTAIATLATVDARRMIAMLPASKSASFRFFVVLTAWSTISLTWAPDGAIVDWAKTLIVVMFGWCVVTPASMASARACTTSVVGLLAILSIERVSGGGLIGMVRVDEPVLRRFDVLSAGLAFLCCLTFPAVSIIARSAKVWALALVTTVSLLAISYYMDAAPVALAAGIVAFGLVSWLGRAGFGLVVTAVLVISVAWGPLVTTAWEFGWSGRLNTMFGPNWGLRLDIWHRVDMLISNDPWLGQGFAIGKIIGRDGSGVPFMHPHNGVMQLWLEMGMIGVALFAGLVIACARRLARLPELPMIAATLAVVSVFWLVSFNVWASWWLAAQAVTIMAATVAVKAATASPEVPAATAEG